MKKFRENILHLLTFFFFLHFAIVFIYLLSNLFTLRATQNITGKYINPFFEQNWSMFSIPGESNRFVLLQYHLINKKSGETYNTSWLDINKPLLSFNNHYYFSISQRLIKYISGCINDIYEVANQSIDSINRNQKLKLNNLLASEFVFNSLKNQSSGYLSLKNYAAIIFNKLRIPEKQKYDSVAFSIKIIDDAFPNYIERNKDFFNQNNHTFTVFNIEYGELFNRFKSRSIGATISRIMISLIILKDLIIYLANIKVLFSNIAVVPYSVYVDILGSYNLKFLQFPFYSQVATLLFLIFALIICLLFLFGIKKYLSGILLFLCLFELRMRNIYIMDGGDNVIWVMLPLLSFVKSNSLLKDPITEKNRILIIPNYIKTHISVLAVFGIALELSFIYFFAALSKMIQQNWENGTALYYILRMDDFRGSSLNVIITRNQLFVKFFTYFTVLWELSFSFLIWFKKTKNIIIPISILMHIGIFILMRIDNFSFIVVSFYPLLFSNHELKKIYAVALDTSLLNRIPAILVQSKMKK